MQSNLNLNSVTSQLHNFYHDILPQSFAVFSLENEVSNYFICCIYEICKVDNLQKNANHSNVIYSLLNSKDNFVQKKIEAGKVWWSSDQQKRIKPLWNSESIYHKNKTVKRKKQQTSGNWKGAKLKIRNYREAEEMEHDAEK